MPVLFPGCSDKDFSVNADGMRRIEGVYPGISLTGEDANPRRGGDEDWR